MKPSHNHTKLIETINVLGPWVHGYFDLGDGIVIEDSDLLQKRRLHVYKDYLIDIIRQHYKKENLNDKTFCDIGCNAGFFMYEMYKHFSFKKAVGYEPRSKNLAKASFIARHFKLPRDRYQLKRFDILNPGRNIPAFDVVLFAAVLPHIDNQIQALKNLYDLTKDICIIETIILPENLNTLELGKRLELKDLVYTGIDKNNFGAIGYKLEDNKLDGSTIHAGIVGIPSLRALEMMLRNVGFSEVIIYRDWKQLKKEVYYGNLHRDVYMAVVVAKKSTGIPKLQDEYDHITRRVHKEELDVAVPEDIIAPCYQYITGQKKITSLPQAAKRICQGELKHFSKRPYYGILQTIKYAPDHKIPFEFAKTCLKNKRTTEAKEVLEGLIKTLNLDWRTVYKSYHLLSLISLQDRSMREAKRYNKLALKAFPSYYPALDLKANLGKKKQ